MLSMRNCARANRLISPGNWAYSPGPKSEGPGIRIHSWTDAPIL